jgi:hypothetical protein
VSTCLASVVIRCTNRRGARRRHASRTWLLPSVAFTSATLLLGGLIGVSRAAAVLGGARVLAIAFPVLVTVRLPALMSPESVPGWILATVVLTGLVVLRAGEDHRRLKGWN